MYGSSWPPPKKQADLKYFISGPMSGLPNYNRDAFNTAEIELMMRGYEVFNPARIRDADSLAYDVLISYCLQQLMGCDVVAILPEWQMSRGSVLEIATASMVNKKLAHIGDPTRFLKVRTTAKCGALEVHIL